MEHLSDIDIRIIAILQKDARITYQDLATALKTNKTNVAYHVGQLKEKGILTSVVPVLNFDFFGVSIYRLYFKLKGLTKDKEDELLKELGRNKHIQSIISSSGRWDLCISIFAKSNTEFFTQKEKIFQLIAPYFVESGFALQYQTLLHNKFIPETTTPKGQIDEVQKKIIRAIYHEGDYSYVDLAKTLDLDERTVRSKIKDLEERKIIEGYTQIYDVRKMGLRRFRLGIELEFSESINALCSYLAEHKEVVYLRSIFFFFFIEVIVEDESFDDVHAFIKNLQNKFPNIIRQIDVTSYSEKHHKVLFPSFF